MNPLQKTLAALAFCIGTGSASAATTIPLIFSNAGGSFTAAFSDTIGANSSFSEYFTFGLSSAASGSADVIASMENGIADLQFTSFQLDTLGSNGFTPVSSGAFVSPFGTNSVSYVSFSSLSRGITYALNVTGNADSTGGTYAGTISLKTITSPQIIAVVPEPYEFELMLAGFGFIGLVKRIRSR
jgi:hypothetical protein